MAYWIRRLQPTVVLGHDPWKRYRLHPDHRHAGLLAVEGIVAARDPHFFPEQALPHHRPEALLLFEADEPDHVEDVDRLRRRQARRAARPHAASCCPRWASTRRATAAEVERQRQAFDERIVARLGEHGALEGVAHGEAFKLIADL